MESEPQRSLAVADSVTLSRRALLSTGVLAAGAAGVAALAGCSAGTEAGTKAATTSGRGATSGQAADSTATAGGAPTTTAAPGGAAKGASALAKVANIPVGGAVSATLDRQPILISQPAAGTIVAFTAICTHMGCTVLPDGKDFQCPCHGSVYNAATGAVLQGPAVAPLAKIATHVVDGEVLSGA